MPEESFQEPVRLVCPDCDTVHRVKDVTLGKLYRCKKCKAPLITMSQAVVECPACGKGRPPAHVDVSRLLTCDTCPSAPLLRLTFPPPVLIMREIDDVPPEEPDWNTLGESPDATTKPPAEPEPTQTDRALARSQQEDQALAVLQDAMNQAQAPLIEEIQRERNSVSLHILAVVVLPVIAAMGYLTYSYFRGQQNREALLGAESRVRDLQLQLELLQRKLTALKLQRDQQTENVTEMSNLIRRQREMYRKKLDELVTQVNKWKGFASKHYRRSRLMEDQLRRLGVDPENGKDTPKVEPEL